MALVPSRGVLIATLFLATTGGRALPLVVAGAELLSVRGALAQAPVGVPPAEPAAPNGDIPNSDPPTPAASPGRGNSAWDQAIQRSSGQEHALETDEERERREERLNRDVVLSGPPTGRLGPRLDVGLVGLGRTNAGWLAAGGLQAVHPLSERYELKFNAAGAIAAGKLEAFGVLAEGGARYVTTRWYGGVAGTFSVLKVSGDENDHQWSGDCTGSNEACGPELINETTALLFVSVDTGFYLNHARTMEVGVDVRLGSEIAHGGLSYLPTAHFAYLFPLW